jgi:hypothetical protein
MFTIAGFLLNFWKWLLVIGVSFIEAFILMLTFNHLAPQVIEMGYTLPLYEISYWSAFSLILFVTVIGSLIQTITPKLITINTTEITESKKEKL